MRLILAVVGAVALVGVQSVSVGFEAQAAERRAPVSPESGAAGAAPRVEALRFTGCSTGQVVMLKDAIGRAATALDRSIGWLRAGAAARDVDTWFGRSDPRRIAATLQTIRDRLQSAAPLQIECNSKVECERGQFAYSDGGGTLAGFCDAFFAMPEEGIDSRFGTVVHELSHLVAGTDDYVYGVEDAQDLAARSPRKAANNADNYEYFVESGQAEWPDRAVGWNRDGRSPAAPREDDTLACKTVGPCGGRPPGGQQ